MRKWKNFRAVLMICAALGWWGIWFPELAVWADAVCVVTQDSAQGSVQQGEKVVECDTAQEICDGLLHADKEQIQLRSRLFTLLEQYLQKNKDECLQK